VGEKFLKIKKLMTNIIVAIILLIVLFPVIWIFFNSFKWDADIISLNFFSTPTLHNYLEVISTERLFTGLVNSTIITSISLLVGFCVGVPMAYIFARLNFWGKENLRFFVGSVRFLPPVAIVVPYLAIWLNAGLYDTHFSLIITYSLISICTMTWLCIECFSAVPINCEEGAAIDGCDAFQVFYKIALPLALPSVFAMLVFTFILLWNEFFMAFILTASKAFTMPVAVASAVTAGLMVPWGRISAMVILLSTPPLIFSYIITRFLPYYYKVS